MRELTGFELEGRGMRRFELSDGKWIDLSADDIERYGLAVLLSYHGYGSEVSAPMIVVERLGGEDVIIGSVPGDFDVKNVKSTNELYSPRPGDFVREGNRIRMVAALGQGDLMAIPGFQPQRQESHYATPTQHETATSAENTNETDS